MPPPVLLATASYDRTIRFWEALSGVCIRTLNFQDSQVNCMCASPDTAFLAAAGHKHIRLYELGASSQVPASTIEAHSGNVTAVAYFRDGRRLVSSSEDGSIKIWDTRTMQRRKQFVVRTAVNCFALHPDQSLIIAGDQSGRLTVWDTLGGTDECVQELVPGGDIGIRSISISHEPHGPICAANNAGDVFVLQLVEGDDVPCDDAAVSDSCSEQDSPVPKPALSRPLPASRSDGAAQEDADGGSAAAPAAAASGGGGGSAPASPSGAAPPRRLRLAHHFKAHNKYILKCVLSPDSTLLATCSADYTIGLWHTSLAGGKGEPWTLYKSLKGHQRWVWDCAFSGDGRHLATASSDNTGKLWDVAKSVDLVILNGHHKPVTCIVVDDHASHGQSDSVT